MTHPLNIQFDTDSYNIAKARACGRLFIGLLIASATWALTSPAAPAESRFGQVHFPIIATPAAQTQFDRAVAMLHSFWYEELEREFAKVTELDSSCPMGYWGIAMGLWHPLWEPPDTNTLKAGLAAVENGNVSAAKRRVNRDT